MSKLVLNEKDFDELLKNKSLMEAMLKPTILDESIHKSNGALIIPLIICDNPYTEIPNVPNQVNFILPLSLRFSKEPYAINIKNDIKMYMNLYEKYSKEVNEIIDKTKMSLQKLYLPLKKLRDEIKKFGKNFKNSIEQLKTPIENKKQGLDEINYLEYPEDLKQKYLNDKEEIIKEVNEFLTEANNFYQNYKKINEKTYKETETFVQKFMELAEPAKELSTFINNFFKVFEKASSEFNDLNDKKKIDNAFKKIKEPLNDFVLKTKNTENKLIAVNEIEKEKKIENVSDIINETKNKMDILKKKSKIISDKISQIRKNYGEKEKILKSMKIPDFSHVNFKECSENLQKEKEDINKIVDNKKENINKGIEIVYNQSRLDLLFIMDITNSMDFYLEQLKKNILDMIETIKEGCAGVDIFLGFIGYRDFSDLDFGENYINLELTKEYNELKKNIQYLEAHGGGDKAEDLCSALEFGVNKNWEGNSRFTVLVTDSPCHGKKYHDLKEDEDNYPEGDRENRNIEEKIQFFAKNNISLFCLKINNTTSKMFEIFRNIYEINKNKDSNNSFIVKQGEILFKAVTENAIKTFQNRKSVDFK